MTTPDDGPKLYREETFTTFVDAVSRHTADRWVRGSWVRKRERDRPQPKPPAVPPATREQSAS
jgi:hypothetical protein